MAVKSIRSDPRWIELVIRYRFNWLIAAVDLFGFEPVVHQVELLKAAQPIGARVTVSSGHGTGKSSQIAIVVLLYMIMYPNARVVLVANKLDQVKIAVFKNIRIYWKGLIKRYPWFEDYFTISESTFYANAEKGVWEVSAKASKVGNEESLAGEHADHLLWIIDEASGLSDKTFDYVEGSLTQVDNRVVLLSQPTRDSGYFWDTHNDPDKSRAWHKLIFNSEESSLVTEQFLINAFFRYGADRNSAQYMIRVRGMFPKSLSGYLLSMDDAVKATKAKFKLPKGWGWVLSADVGNGRDSSVINIAKVWGDGLGRRIKGVKITEYEGNINSINFAREIINVVKTGEYPNVSVLIDGDGIGAGTADLVEEAGINVQRIRWGGKMFNKDDRNLYQDQRAYASITLRDRIRAGMVRLDRNTKTLNQASKIPYGIDGKGRFVIEQKKVMRAKLNIKSPDRFDTYCFMMLADIMPASSVISRHSLQERDMVGNWDKEVTVSS
ncbi:MAG: phage terminase large subunit [Shewanella sp.]